MPSASIKIFPDGSGEMRLLDENGKIVRTLKHPNIVEAAQSIEQAKAEGWSYAKFRWFRDHPGNEQ